MLDYTHFAPLIDPDGATMKDARLIPNPDLITVSADPRNVAAPWVAMQNAPKVNAATVTSLLHGEQFMLLGIDGDWAYGQATYDRYVGWLPKIALNEKPQAPNAMVTALLTNVYSEADIKSQPLKPLPMGAQITMEPDTVEGAFVKLSSGGWVTQSHVSTLPYAVGDMVETAKMFLECPYLWGGRTMGGLDCSALVQLALMQSGLRCHRDSDLQFKSLGIAIETADAQEGDLMFFPGHVGIVMDGGNVLHANATRMKVSIDPIDDVVSWIENGREGKANDQPTILGVKRLP